MNIRSILKRLSGQKEICSAPARMYSLPPQDGPSDAEIVRGWSVVASNPKYEGKRIPDGDGVALYRLVKHLQPERCLEVGYYSGASTIAICSALRDAGRQPSKQHLALDLEDWNGGPQNVASAGLGNFVNFVTGDSALTLPRLVDNGE